MRSFPLFARSGVGQNVPLLRHPLRVGRPFVLRQQGVWRRHCFPHQPPRPRRFIRRTIALGVLSPAAFLRVAEEEEQENGETSEERMLHMSRAEIAKVVPEDMHGFQRLRRSLYLAVENYVIEPLATGVRFIRLVIIFVPLILAVPVIWLGSRRANRNNERSGTLWWYEFLVSSMERAGPAFIKLGQWAASRTDIFPTEMCAVMSELHSNAPAHSLAVTKRIISQAFNGRPMDEIFDEFDEKPLGVGAIAQVYKARLKPGLAMPDDVHTDVEVLAAAPSGKLRQNIRKNVDALVKRPAPRGPSSYVAIKVLHPKVERIVRRDLRIMGFFAAVINAIPTMEWLSLPDEVVQFGEMMRLQLDLRIEAANLTKFRKHFRNRRTAWFPCPYTEYTTRQMLIEEFAHGIPLDVFLESGGGAFQKDLADEGLDAFLHMLLIDNFVHADLHPGNIMVRFYKPEGLKVTNPFARLSFSSAQAPSPDPLSAPPAPTSDPSDATEEVLQRLRPLRHQPAAWAAELAALDAAGYRPQVIFIDAGLVTQLNSLNRRNFLDLFKAIAEFNGYKAGQLMVQRCRQPDAVREPDVFALKMQHLVLGVKSRTFALGNVSIGDVLHSVLDMVRTHHVRLEGDFVNVVISILLLEGIGRSLDPDLDLFKSALPILRELGAQSGSGSLLQSVRRGDTSMLKVWVGLEARKFVQASIDDVERCVRYDLLSPNV
ncbi:MAG: hypothetical protein M1826_001847 [Phylliscum demangeonii]|nr:MAG: hypothetical protein M1826_001847 [Phylliscum demangeonii]